jgi:transposase
MDLRALHRHGWSTSALARRFGLNRRTVAREVAAAGPRPYPPRAAKHPLTPAQLAHIERRLLVCPVLRATDLHRELQRDFGYSGSYASFGRQLRPLRPAVITEPEVRFETAAGVQTQVDWKHLGAWPLGEEVVPLHALVAVLGHSRMPAIRIATSCTRQVTFERLLRCLDDLGGVSRELLTDRDTVFCTAGGSLLSPEWLDLCELLGTVPRLCRPYRAKTKGKVERVNREVQESFLAWLTGQPLSPRPTHGLAAAWRSWSLCTLCTAVQPPCPAPPSPHDYGCLSTRGDHPSTTFTPEECAFLLCGGAARLAPSRRVREYVQLSLVFPVLHGHSELATHS